MHLRAPVHINRVVSVSSVVLWTVAGTSQRRVVSLCMPGFQAWHDTCSACCYLYDRLSGMCSHVTGDHFISFNWAPYHLRSVVLSVSVFLHTSCLAFPRLTSTGLDLASNSAGLSFFGLHTDLHSARASLGHTDTWQSCSSRTVKHYTLSPLMPPVLDLVPLQKILIDF